MCVDAGIDAVVRRRQSSQTEADLNTVPGITYMLAGATQRSDSDPNDMTSMPIEIGPHWMIMWPFDPKTTSLPTTHKPTGAYIMFSRARLTPISISWGVPECSHRSHFAGPYT